MTPIDAKAPARRPYWLLVVFAALMLSPPAWAAAALIATAVAVTVAGGIRRVAARRKLDAGAARSGEVTVLGTDRDGRQVVLGDDQLSAHGLILGASGSGKSTTLLAIVSDHVQRGRPVVAVDMKGSPAFARQLAGSAAAVGRPFRVWTLDGPSHWNPLQHGNATELKDKLIATERFSEPHYQRAAERYVQTALQVLHELHPDRAATLDEVVGLMDPRRLSGVLRGVSRERAERVQDYLSGMTPDQLSAVRGLGTRLAIITESHVGRFLGPQEATGRRFLEAQAATSLRFVGPPGTTNPRSAAAGASNAGATIDLRAALEGDEVALFSLNSSTYGKLAAQIGALVIQDLVAAVGHRLELNGGVPVSGDRQAMIGIDEFSALGADNVVALVARAREAGSSLLLATQELADLDRAAPGLRDQIVGSSAIKLIHRQDVPSSAQTVAQMAGTVRRWDQTEQIGGRLFGAHANGRGTRRQVEEFLVHPNQIKTLRTGEAVVISKTPRTTVRMIRVRPPSRGGPDRGSPDQVGPASAGPDRGGPPGASPPCGGPELA